MCGGAGGEHTGSKRLGLGFNTVDISSSTLSCFSVFFYQLWNLNHSLFRGDTQPTLCPCLHVSLCVCMCKWGFPVQQYSKHSWPDGWLVMGQIHTSGTPTRSEVFVQVQQCTYTHTDKHKNTHTHILHSGHTPISTIEPRTDCVVYALFVEYEHIWVETQTHIHIHRGRERERERHSHTPGRQTLVETQNFVQQRFPLSPAPHDVFQCSF